MNKIKYTQGCFYPLFSIEIMAFKPISNLVSTIDNPTHLGIGIFWLKWEFRFNLKYKK